MLPKTRIDIKGNRLVGADHYQQKNNRGESNASDIVANFHSNSSFSKIGLVSILERLKTLLSQTEEVPKS